jgi:hypothetical protein
MAATPPIYFARPTSDCQFDTKSQRIQHSFHEDVTHLDPKERLVKNVFCSGYLMTSRVIGALTFWRLIELS